MLAFQTGFGHRGRMRLGGKTATPTRWWKGRERGLLAWGVTLVYALLLALSMRHHEMWRDEIQAWLLARDAPSWWGVLHTIRYEGHPGLWHLLLWPFARLSWNPVGMQVAHGIVASSAVWCLVRFAPFAWPFRVLLPFGYVLFFEWGVIARNYALSALLLFLACAFMRGHWRRFPRAAAMLALACHTNVHTLLLVLVLTPLTMLEYAVAVAGRRRGAHRCRGRVVAGFALILLGLVTAVRQVAPPPDSGFATGWFWQWHASRAAQAVLTGVRAHVPVPVAGAGHYWNTCRFLEQRLGAGGDRSARSVTLARQSAAVAFAMAVLVLARRPWHLVHWGLGTLALNVFFYVKYMGSMRHHAFHWLWALVVLWLAFERRPWKTGSVRWDRWLARVEGGVLGMLLLASVTVQLWACRVAVAADRRQVFSNSKAAAAWLRSEGLLDGDVVFAGQRGPQVSATVGHAALPRIYYTGRKAYGSYIVWDRHYARVLHGAELVEELRRLRAETGRELVFLSSVAWPENQRPADVREVAVFDAPYATDAVWIYRWPSDGAAPES